MDKETTRQLIRELGGPKRLSLLLGISASAVSQWEEIPVYRALQLEKLMGMDASRYKLRPDIFGPIEQNQTSNADRRLRQDRRAHPCPGRRASDKGQAA